MSRANREALKALAAKAVGREALRAGGYHSLCHSSDLFRHGYRVRHWFRPCDRHELLEYLPRDSDLPRLTAGSYAEQAAIHVAIGLNLVPPGAPWTDYRQVGLFDGQLGGDAA